MPPKRIPSEVEIQKMAADFLPFIKSGEGVVSFLRRNLTRVENLRREESWDTVARVMTAIGITYRTGKPWNRDDISREVRRAKKNLRAEEKRQSGHIPEQLIPPPATPPDRGSQPAAQTPRQIETPADVQATSVREKVPRFRPASLKPYEPPRALTPDEIKEREANRVRMFGQ